MKGRGVLHLKWGSDVKKCIASTSLVFFPLPFPTLLLCHTFSHALGSVAIAISLVPPLCVVGISLRCAQISAASGALLLFMMTNFLAVLFAGGMVLVLIVLGRSAISSLFCQIG
jgi:Domain of unknown function (DUF389)